MHALIFISFGFTHCFGFSYTYHSLTLFRFTFIELFRYSDDALIEIISDSSPRKSIGSIHGNEEYTASCPCIENIGCDMDNGIIMNSCPATVTTPLLS